MKLEQSFEVSAPVEEVWRALIDVERVAPCLPGASVTGRNEDGSYNGAFTIKIGPTTASYTGKLEMKDVDESSHTATMHANGSDRRGQGGANATIFSKLTETNGGTRVEVDTDYHITGRLARFGRGGMIEDISERLLRDFAKRLQDSLAQDSTAGASEAAPEAAPAAQEPEPAAPAAEAASSASEPDSAASEAAPSGSEPDSAGSEPAASASEPEPVAASPDDVPEPVAHEQAPDPAVPEPEAAPPPPAPESAPAPEAAAPPPPPPPPPPPQVPAEPLDAGSLVGSVMWDRAKKNPAPFVAGIIVVILFLLRRRRRR